MEIIVLTLVSVAMFILGYSAGATATKSPSESEMFDRIVQSRLDKRLTDDMRNNLEREISRALDNRRAI